MIQDVKKRNKAKQSKFLSLVIKLHLFAEVLVPTGVRLLGEFSLKFQTVQLNRLCFLSPEEIYENKILFSQYGVKIRNQAAG